MERLTKSNAYAEQGARAFVPPLEGRPRSGGALLGFSPSYLTPSASCSRNFAPAVAERRPALEAIRPLPPVAGVSVCETNKAFSD
jgi:hypothetical protein